MEELRNLPDGQSRPYTGPTIAKLQYCRLLVLKNDKQIGLAHMKPDHWPKSYIRELEMKPTSAFLACSDVEYPFKINLNVDITTHLEKEKYKPTPMEVIIRENSVIVMTAEEARFYKI